MTARFFFDAGDVDRIRRNDLTRENQVALVGDDPFDGLAFVELDGLRDRGGEVDVPLLAGLTFDELDFGWESHRLSI